MNDTTHNGTYSDARTKRKARADALRQAQQKKHARLKLAGLVCAGVLVCICALGILFSFVTSTTTEISEKESSKNTADTTNSSEEVPSEYFTGYSSTGKIIENIDGLTYVDGILIINKTYSAPQDFDPGEDPEKEAALETMIADAAEQGLEITRHSGYRDYSWQDELYSYYVAKDGVEEADTYSARPGHSEHQSGLAQDLCLLEESFAETAEGIWLAEHCHEYGFIIRYPKGKEDITGYTYEPWHVRYVGIELATYLYDEDLCLEEYLGITSVYPD